LGSDSDFVGRKGAARIALIPPEVLDALNAGRIPTVNLNEFLALDLPLLARNVARDVGLDPHAERLQDTLAMLGAFPPVKRHLHVARAFYDLTQPRAERDGIACCSPGPRTRTRTSAASPARRRARAASGARRSRS
jgi:hypothetical protein